MYLFLHFIFFVVRGWQSYFDRTRCAYSKYFINTQAHNINKDLDFEVLPKNSVANFTCNTAKVGNLFIKYYYLHVIVKRESIMKIGKAIWQKLQIGQGG